ncbi:MAG: hypothetical protein JRN20_14600 [Nitrososphaerota archaeon]|jgi:hypothetical protein|nr:hypothetical protein [Nitrososphaerota archaeon]
MPKWKKNEKEFSISVYYDEKRGYQIYLPRPIAELLKRPERIKFSIKGSKIEVSASE